MTTLIMLSCSATGSIASIGKVVSSRANYPGPELGLGRVTKRPGPEGHYGGPAHLGGPCAGLVGGPDPGPRPVVPWCAVFNERTGAGRPIRVAREATVRQVGKQ